MSSTFTTRQKATQGIGKLFGGSTTEEIYLQFVPGIVLDVVVKDINGYPFAIKTQIWKGMQIQWEGDVKRERDAFIREFTISQTERPITGVLWHGETTKPGAPLVCFGHGASGDRHQRPIPRPEGSRSAAPTAWPVWQPR